jgi:hypothetical protein
LILEDDIPSLWDDGVDADLREVLDCTLWTDELVSCDLFRASVVDQWVHGGGREDGVRVAMKHSNFKERCGGFEESEETLLREYWRERESERQRDREGGAPVK